MSGDKQIQKAGDSSTQIQTQNLTIVQGIDEKRAREIFSEMYEVAKRDFSLDAYNTANERVKKFEDLLISKMEKIDGALNSFADPSFQILLSKANKTAACTEREPDYNLLSELLVHRIEKKESRKDIAGISRAVEIVDQIDDDALCGLTVFHIAETLSPSTQDVINALDIFEDLFSKLIICELPQKAKWLEHLDILNAIRYSSFVPLKKFEDYLCEKFSGFVCVGIKKDSDDYLKAIELLKQNNLPDLCCLWENELLSDYYRIPIINESKIETFSPTIKNQITINIPLNTNQKSALYKIYKTYVNDNVLIKTVKQHFFDEIEKRPSLKKLKSWWNDIPGSIDINIVGSIIARTNAQRLEPSIPPLNN